ncbi:hypothetical protein F4861DRAFT_261656 [Xylaria intraflava]|nr:hypothetical protein F4861DRAFT_261656 [Xylaria intraflava]
MFTLYNVSRPSGWFSDKEDLLLSGGDNISQRRYYRYCHFCSAPARALIHCSSCGHRICKKCSREVRGDTSQTHTNFLHRPNPTVARDELQHVSASGLNSESISDCNREIKTAHSTSKGQDQYYVDTQRQPPNIYAEHNRRTTNGEPEEETIPSEIFAPAIRQCSHINGGQPEQIQIISTRSVMKNPVLHSKNLKEQEVRQDASTNRVECDDPICRATHAGHHPFRHSVSCPKKDSGQSARDVLLENALSEPPVAEVVDNPGSNSTSNLVNGDTVHYHHSIGLQSDHHAAGHLSSAVGHDSCHLNNRATEWINPYIEPMRKPYEPPDETTHEVRETALGETTDDCEPKKAYSGSNRPSALYDSNLKIRLASTPSWLKSPTKAAANATALLHHVNTKDHKTHDHDHGYLSNIVVDNSKGHAASSLRRSVPKINIRGDSEYLNSLAESSQKPDQIAALSPHTALPATQQQATHCPSNSPYHEDRGRPRSNRKAKVPSHVAPEIRITRASFECSPPNDSISVPRRGISESDQGYTNVTLPTDKMSHERNNSVIHRVPSGLAQHQESTSDESGLSQSLIAILNPQDALQRLAAQPRRTEDYSTESDNSYVCQREFIKAATSTSFEPNLKLENSETKSFTEDLSEARTTQRALVSPPSHECS